MRTCLKRYECSDFSISPPRHIHASSRSSDVLEPLANLSWVSIDRNWKKLAQKMEWGRLASASDFPFCVRLPSEQNVFREMVIYSTMTGTPGFTIAASFTTSQLARRMHPWLALRPIESGSSVPWMPMPSLSSAIHITPAGLFGPGGSRREFELRFPSLSILRS
jgi:hypothetical protein